MSGDKKDTVLAVLQLSGGNDGMNTVVPYGDPLYFDNRQNVRVPEEQVIPINDYLGFNPNMGPIKELWDMGKVAIIQGIGYPHWVRTHFRSMDIWHTCEPQKVVNEGWLGKTIRELDPDKENVLTGVNFGRGLPRAMAAPGVPVASVGDLETYGLLTGMSGQDQREEALDVFSNLYTPMLGNTMVMDYITQTGMDALKGADILATAPLQYSSSVEYARNSVAQYVRNMAQVHTAGLGTRILYTTAPYNSFDTHAGEMANHSRLWTETSRTASDFYEDLKEHEAGDNVITLLFSEFGRRVRDNGSGTDHGAAGVTLVIGEKVKGGLYGEYPSLKDGDLIDGDLVYNNDFRGTYATILEKWLGVDSKVVLGDSFEQLDFI